MPIIDDLSRLESESGAYSQVPDRMTIIQLYAANAVIEAIALSTGNVDRAEEIRALKIDVPSVVRHLITTFPVRK